MTRWRGGRYSRWGLCALLAVLLAGESVTPRVGHASPSGVLTLSATIRPAIVIELDPPAGTVNVLRATRGHGNNPPDARYYALSEPVTIAVRSNGPWTGTMTAQIISGTSPGNTIASSALHYNTVPATTFNEAASSPHLDEQPITWGSGGTPGTFRVDHYFFLRAGPADPETFTAAVTYTVSQPHGGVLVSATVTLVFHAP